MVRLKVVAYFITYVRQFGFNSTMVRLKVPLTSHIYVNPLMFQFHNGSIKSRGVGVTPLSRGLVSIPQWFD